MLRGLGGFCCKAADIQGMNGRVVKQWLMRNDLEEVVRIHRCSLSNSKLSVGQSAIRFQGCPRARVPDLQEAVAMS